MSDYCNKCKQLIETTVLECSLCLGKYHVNCGDLRDLEISGLQRQGCYRCARSEHRRKQSITNNQITESQNNNPSMYTPVFTANLIRPPPMLHANHP